LIYAGKISNTLESLGSLFSFLLFSNYLALAGLPREGEAPAGLVKNINENDLEKSPRQGINQQGINKFNLLFIE
jgi:hypothetical protein